MSFIESNQTNRLAEIDYFVHRQYDREPLFRSTRIHSSIQKQDDKK